ncbi:hypothetical protein FSP39_001266 [Pinctada imbricata]|uniref:SGNH hydrolase-type esterase domain-containing protein n=1 Tax=Pinctada imbricata TaxID=66713 RepID=A0AA89BMP5_PINIB|nr:hypothetical protein FSP39_001266 [Pinctada imbricata]
MDKDIREFGEYAGEIREGRESNAFFDNADQGTNAESKSDQLVILGASNCKRCVFDQLDAGVINASISGSTISNVTPNLELATTEIKNPAEVSKVIICLGTNDVSRNKSRPDKINVHVTKTLEVVKNTFDNAEIGICTIIPRKGRSVHIQELNNTTLAVNDFIKTVCEEDDDVKIIDLSAIFTKEGVANQSLYDTQDSNGVHINTLGAKLITDAFHNFRSRLDLNDRKRMRGASSTSSVPSPIIRKEKKAKC